MWQLWVVVRGTAKSYGSVVGVGWAVLRAKTSTEHSNRHRYYSPELGRYLNADPIGQAGGINTFSYAESNPATAFDPLGLNNFGGPVFQTSSPNAPLYRPPGPLFPQWSIAAQAYTPAGGGGIEIGKCSADGPFYVKARIGWGAGAGVSCSSEPSLQGRAICEQDPGGAAGLFGEVTAGLGPVELGIEGGAGGKNDGPEEYFDVDPNVSLGKSFSKKFFFAGGGEAGLTIGGRQ